ncbi:MAG: NAD-dependent epimerase/dehydratase family protein [Synergistaceae bacterium]|nr:NAD-dependent epimerase/dehydratase family protein [Synergistaceae bacterium]
MINHNLYLDDLNFLDSLRLDWGKISGKTFLISGASGLIGTLLVDVLMKKNCNVHALGRSYDKAAKRFASYIHEKNFEFTQQDINAPLNISANNKKYDYVIHLASNTHPVDYSADPVGTIMTNIKGLDNMLKFAVDHDSGRFMFASSVEVYGENRDDTEFFDENYCGYINISKARSGYPESKRCGETLCLSYMQQYGLSVVIPRFSRTYGPTMQMSDSKAIAQFIKKGISGENIILKSAGNQLYSYSYAADAVSGLLTILTQGADGSAYNIADENSDITLKDLAELIAQYSGTRVVFELPDEKEARGYSAAVKARLDSSRLKSLGWRAHYDIKSGIKRTLDILKAVTH